MSEPAGVFQRHFPTRDGAHVTVRDDGYRISAQVNGGEWVTIMEYKHCDDDELARAVVDFLMGTQPALRQRCDWCAKP
jgi:hypothetical protein